jgi:hypothetical protein
MYGIERKIRENRREHKILRICSSPKLLAMPVVMAVKESAAKKVEVLNGGVVGHGVVAAAHQHSVEALLHTWRFLLHRHKSYIGYRSHLNNRILLAINLSIFLGYRPPQ